MWSRLVAEIRRYPRAFWLLWIGSLLNRLGAFVVPFLTLYLTGQRGYSETAAGLVVSLYGVGGIAAALLGGVMTDRVGRRATLLLSMGGGAAALLALGFARTPFAIGGLTCLCGFLCEMYRPAVGAMVADLVPPADRGRAYGHMYWAVNLGFALAPTLGGLLARADYTLLFVIDATTMAAFGLVALLMLPETRPAEAIASHSRGGIRQVLGDRTFMALVVLTFCLAIVLWQNAVALPLDMRRKGLDELQYGSVIALNGVLIILFQPLALSYVLGRRRSTMLAMGTLLTGVGFGLNAWVGVPLGYALAVAIWTAGEIIHAPVWSAVIADLAPPALRGRYQGLNGGAWSTAAALGPLAGGAVYETLGPAALWGVCFGLCAAAAVGHRLVGPAHERRAVPTRA